VACTLPSVLKFGGTERFLDSMLSSVFRSIGLLELFFSSSLDSPRSDCLRSDCLRLSKALNRPVRPEAPEFADARLGSKIKGRLASCTGGCYASRFVSSPET